jgi:hypothetical protein
MGFKFRLHCVERICFFMNLELVELYQKNTRISRRDYF